MRWIDISISSSLQLHPYGASFAFSFLFPPQPASCLARFLCLESYLHLIFALLFLAFLILPFGTLACLPFLLLTFWRAPPLDAKGLHRPPEKCHSAAPITAALNQGVQQRPLHYI